ncbi:MAG: hypothetical protein HKL80_07065 [Acidimicrobiales bacterium]|nr:hypothetical protein [Acidimicrobiales bacterium]
MEIDGFNDSEFSETLNKGSKGFLDNLMQVSVWCLLATFELVIFAVAWAMFQVNLLVSYSRPDSWFGKTTFGTGVDIAIGVTMTLVACALIVGSALNLGRVTSDKISRFLKVRALFLITGIALFLPTFLQWFVVMIDFRQK